jgi:hypothetical protein
LLLQQEGAQMCTVDLIAREGDGQVVAVLRGELGRARASRPAAATVTGPAVVLAAT